MHLLLTAFFSALITLALVHIVSLQFFLYWKYLWLDIPMHFLGGICIALGVGILPFFRIKLAPRYRTFFAYMIVVLIVGIIWEIFEIKAGISIMDQDFVTDTAIDLCMDLLGGMIGFGIIKSMQKIEYA